jgi:hypothetical protein
MRLCTRGVYFEPDDARLPLTKFPFRQMPGCPITHTELPLSSNLLLALGPGRGDETKVMYLQPLSCVEMKINNVIGPYQSIALAGAGEPQRDVATVQVGRGRGAAVAKSSQIASGASSHAPGRTTVVFSLQHTAPSSLSPLARQLWCIQRQCAAGAHASFERSELAPILGSRREGPFDLSLMTDYRERPLLPAGPAAIYAERVHPFVVCPGRLMVTERASE